MVLFALSFQGQVEKYGVYVGIAAFFGLAVLSLLYFAQARELKRLREWAGRAPERAAEVESRVAEQAQRRVQAQPARPAAGAGSERRRRAASACATTRSSSSWARSGARPAHARRRLSSRACAK